MHIFLSYDDFYLSRPDTQRRAVELLEQRMEPQQFPLRQQHSNLSDEWHTRSTELPGGWRNVSGLESMSMDSRQRKAEHGTLKRVLYSFKNAYVRFERRNSLRWLRLSGPYLKDLPYKEAGFPNLNVKDLSLFAG